MRPYPNLTPLRFLAVLLFATSAFAQSITYPTYAVGNAYGGLYYGNPGTGHCDRTLYDPTVYQLNTDPNSPILHILSQGGSPTAGCSHLDAFIGTTRDAVGQYSFPIWNPTQPDPANYNGCPELYGKYLRCSFDNTSSFAGPVSSPSVVKVGSTYYMAFTGGNADYVRGHIYWAKSSDGTNWTVWTLGNTDGSQIWTPIVRPLDPVGDSANACKGPSPNPYQRQGYPSTPNTNNAISHVSLVYDPDTSESSQGIFYIFFTYFHEPLHPACDGPNGSCPGRRPT